MKRLSIWAIVILLTFSAGIWIGAKKERDRCAILFLDDTLLDINRTYWFSKNLNEKGSEEAELKLSRYIASGFEHLEAVLESSSGISEYQLSWKDSRYPQTLFFNLNQELKSLRKAVAEARTRTMHVEPSVTPNPPTSGPVD